MGETPVDPAVRHQQLARQFLVHSFLYYRLGESIIGDSAYDQLAKELHRLHKDAPALELPFANLLKPALGAEASGFQIRTYPPEIVSTAFKLLYDHQAPAVEFTEFVERRGYQIEQG